jgi:two-component system torCAD operon response regulator TorR
VNVRSQDSALRDDLNFQAAPQARRTSNNVVDSGRQELRPAGRERLIVVEDDPVTRTMLVGYFNENNFDVVGAGSCAECRQALRSRTDLVFLDVQLPDGDGFELAKEIQATSNAGIIFVTRRDTDVDRILGLEIAGDHYVTKPINLRDLLARARSVLRRRSIDRKAARNHNSIAFGDWIIDLTRRELLGIRTVDALVARLRRKLVGSGTPVIATVTGVGYKLALSERL